MSNIYIEIATRAGGTIIGGAALYLLQLLVRAAIDMRDNVRDIMKNHLPHLEQEITGLKGAIHELTQKLH